MQRVVVWLATAFYRVHATYLIPPSLVRREDEQFEGIAVDSRGDPEDLSADSHFRRMDAKHKIGTPPDDKWMPESSLGQHESDVHEISYSEPQDKSSALDNAAPSHTRQFADEKHSISYRSVASGTASSAHGEDPEESEISSHDAHDEISKKENSGNTKRGDDIDGTQTRNTIQTNSREVNSNASRESSMLITPSESRKMMDDAPGSIEAEEVHLNARDYIVLTYFVRDVEVWMSDPLTGFPQHQKNRFVGQNLFVHVLRRTMSRLIRPRETISEET